MGSDFDLRFEAGDVTADRVGEGSRDAGDADPSPATFRGPSVAAL